MRMISEGPCDTEDWIIESFDYMNELHFYKIIKNKIVIINSSNISQYYYFYI